MIDSRNPRVSIRPLTQQDFDVFYEGNRSYQSLRGYSFSLDGELAGVAGIMYCGGGFFIAFSDIKSHVNVEKVTIWRCTLEVMKMIDKMKIPVFADRDISKNNSAGFLKKLGFVETSQDGMYFRDAR